MRGNPILLLIIAVLPEILHILLKDMIIINLGIAEYRTIGYGVHLLLVFMLILSVSSFWRKYKDREIKESLTHLMYHCLHMDISLRMELNRHQKMHWKR